MKSKTLPLDFYCQLPRALLVPFWCCDSIHGRKRKLHKNEKFTLWWQRIRVCFHSYEFPPNDGFSDATFTEKFFLPPRGSLSSIMYVGIWLRQIIQKWPIIVSNTTICLKRFTHLSFPYRFSWILEMWRLLFQITRSRRTSKWHAFPYYLTGALLRRDEARTEAKVRELIRAIRYWIGCLSAFTMQVLSPRHVVNTWRPRHYIHHSLNYQEKALQSYHPAWEKRRQNAPTSPLCYNGLDEGPNHHSKAFKR